jgi:glyoxylase-like metal-dependent hydrolase (beta-lactamase superfamily II)
MTSFIKTLSLALFLSLTLHVHATDYLSKCATKQVSALAGKNFSFSYQEKLNQLEHSFEPWQQTNYTGKGIVWVNNTDFLKQDTLVTGKRTYYSKTQLSKSDLLFLDYGDKDLYPVTEGTFLDQTFLTARYSPVTLLNYFSEHKIALDKQSTKDVAVYKTIINKTIVHLYIRKSDCLLSKVTTLSDDELFGDVLSTYIYKDYVNLVSFFYPKNIEIQKYNGRVTDEVSIHIANLSTEFPKLLDKPANYILKKDEEPKTEVKTEKYSDHIYFIELKHTDDKVLLVEFKDFFVVEGAPINSKNGELIINEAKKIAPNKPIKYFTFGHYHPHYLGGMRPFIQKGATVLSTAGDTAYVTYLANASHSINPDSLQLKPKALKLEEIKERKTISDGNFEMIIYYIGKKSAHTNDYMIYYFPTEQLLYEDDLVWIPKQGAITKARDRQAGLYHTIKELGLHVKTIVQSWPVSDYGVKTVIPFAEMEESMKDE